MSRIVLKFSSQTTAGQSRRLLRLAIELGLLPGVTLVEDDDRPRELVLRKKSEQ